LLLGDIVKTFLCTGGKGVKSKNKKKYV